MCTGLPKHGDSDPRRIWRLPGFPPQHRCPVDLVGLALVAAIQAELDSIKQPRVDSHPFDKQADRRSQVKADRRSQVKAMDSNPKPSSRAPLPLHFGDEGASPKSIFTLSSSPTKPYVLLGDDDLPLFNPRCFTSCSLCRRPLIPTKDIYMYRDDQAFCTMQCRQHQILIDEQKEKACSHGKG
ncbi:hypothetical protein GOP47_0027262 [Adiantum capillus-veneris]|nr:hypothetical protein GOP47_0027262 [Adiantum capillus-veneris]